MKKRFKALLLAGFVAMTSLTLFACGGEQGNNVKVYETLDNIVTEFKENKERVFSPQTVNTIPSNYALSALDGEDSYFNALFILPINYIAKNYIAVKDVEGAKLSAAAKAETKKLIANANAMLKNYEKVKYQYQRLSLFDKNQSALIYQGALQLYKYECDEFIGSTYRTALSLAKLEELAFNSFSSLITAETISTEETAHFRDFVSLFIGYDYYKVLINNCQTTALSKLPELLKWQQDFVTYEKEVAGNDNFNSLISGESGGTIIRKNVAVSGILNAIELTDKDRNIFDKALEGFSYYEYYFTYNREINKYKTAKAYSDIHYQTINSFMETEYGEFTKFVKSIFIKP